MIGNRFLRRFSPAQRQQYLDDYRRSGLTQPEFAQRNGLILSTFKGWLGDERRQRTSKAASKTPQPLLREVPLSAVLNPSPWAAEVVLPGGATLRLNAQASPQLLSSLLQNLRPC